MAERISPLTASASPSLDQRIEALNSLVAQLTAGDLAARGTPSGHADPLDQIMCGVHQLADRLQQWQADDSATEQRAYDLLEVMMGVATLDYSRRAAVGDGDSIFDAIASGLNMLVDELVAAQEAQARLQGEIIQAQAAAIQELSSPLMPISDDVLVMPLIGSIDTARAQQILERLLVGVTDHHAHTIIMDITGVPVVDTQVANVLIQAAQGVRLLGARAVLTGIRPEIAQTLVGLGVDLGSIVTRSNLQMGVAYALQSAPGLRDNRPRQAQGAAALARP